MGQSVILIKLSRPSADQKGMAVLTEIGNLVSLVYVSSAIRGFEPDELIEILRKSRVNNERLSITGMLLYKDGNFMQVLEGPGESVDKLMSSVEKDKRHRGIIVLTRRQIAERQFAKWSMAFKDLNNLSAEDQRGYSPFLAGSLLDQDFQAKPDRCYKLLLHFKNNCR